MNRKEFLKRIAGAVGLGSLAAVTQQEMPATNLPPSAEPLVFNGGEWVTLTYTTGASSGTCTVWSVRA
jgi:hypothetical protein